MDRVQYWVEEDRRRRRYRHQREWLYAGLIFSVSIGFFLFGLKAGLYLEPYHIPGEVSRSQPVSVNSSSADQLRIDGYTFVFEPENSSKFHDNTIGQVNYLQPNKIYIQKGLGSEETYSVCVHEKLHLLRLEEDSEEMHDWIYEHEEVIPDSTCFDLVRHRFGLESVSDVRDFVERRFESKLSREMPY